ncbi:MAG: hypothetical protein GXP53_00005, partial [Deltaproteobacteria bacterium]|nr:hypothetical protein [Deltaproteobacteria bacterium]
TEVDASAEPVALEEDTASAAEDGEPESAVAEPAQAQEADVEKEEKAD